MRHSRSGFSGAVGLRAIVIAPCRCCGSRGPRTPRARPKDRQRGRDHLVHRI